ncbi:Odorant receptor 249 [Nylanderia fulva]|uniref:Odorant receptor n=1 Tax=Nylanderia fulva TaxID=613905 RepID=A0A6G1LQH7_9HYME|nr:odorant receptor 13a-like [Nylanderia fulva]KAF3054387.1 Odorant receptor 249 [Nylanderia fulva]
MAEGKDILQSRYYTIPRFYMTLAGLWPYHSIRDRYLHFVPTFTVCFIIFIPQVLYVHIALTDLDDLFECIPTMLITIIFSFKLASLMANSKKIKTCLKTVQDDWLSLSTDNEKAILQRQAAYGRYLTIFYAGLMLLTGFLYIIKSVVLILIEDSSNSTKLAVTKLPFRVEYGQKIDQYFYLILVHNYLTVCSHVTATVATDTLYFTLIQHACGMFSVVGHSLERIGKDSDDNFDLKPDKIRDVNYNKVLECLRKHLHVIEFAEMIESTFANIFLVSISLNMVGGSICGIQVLMNLNNDAKDIIAPLAIYIAQLTHLFLQFWQAQFLLDYSVLPYESICKANWYYTSMRCRKLLLLIMNRTVLPCRITAGKVVTLSIESFGVVLKTSMSYFTMLRSFH